jgi:EAL domain-containing protein (putative c-di-GMP-specific phosphodiesterase class I)
MAHRLGLVVIAEGVETDAQLTHLAQQQCEMAQGYLFSTPLPADEMTRILASDLSLPILNEANESNPGQQPGHPVTNI